MTVTITDPAVVNKGGVATTLSSLISITPGSDNPAFLLVTAYDYNEYAKGSTTATGHFSGNNHNLSLTTVANDPGGRAANIIFTYNASTGQYTNSTYGNLENLTYTSSTNPTDVTQISVYGLQTTNILPNLYADVVQAQSNLSSAYLGSATVCTESSFTGTIPSNATPDSIEAVAQTFVGKTWNASGCWLLASTISAEAGSSLSPSTISSPLPNVGNGAWFVAFNGNPTATNAVASEPSTDTSWLNYVKAGEIIDIPNHILTVVSGTGLNAKIIDNYTDGTNTANDTNPNGQSDILIMAPHSLSDDVVSNGTVWVTSNMVTVYELDTPVVSALSYTGKTAAVALSQLASAVDPNNTAITEYQVYDLVSGDTFTVAGHASSATTAATAITASSLSSITFNGTGVADTIEVRAENTSGYWGDWTAITVPASFNPNSPSAKDVAAFNAGTLPAGPITLSDAAANVTANLDGLEVISTANGIASITLTDGGIPTINLSASQLSSDGGVLNKIGGYFSLDISAPTTSTNITGFAGHANTVVFSGDASQYTITPDGNGNGFTITNGSMTDHLSNVTALQFSDFTDIVASQTSPNGGVSSAQVTNLYAAVLARQPDVAGLAYYENVAATNPGISITTYAEWFLSSPEYTNAHTYAQTPAGDAQFITDTYNNLLHRAPEAGAVSWYQTNVIDTYLNGVTPGTTAYTNAELLAHAMVLTYFSASAEFLGDVQITAQNHVSAQHWLMLV